MALPEINPQPVQSKFLTNESDIVFFGGGGGGGKTWSILVDNLKYVHDPNYFSVYFRNTTTELDTNLWPEAIKMYRPYLEHQSGPSKGKWKGKAKIRDQQHEIIFPSGAKSRFSYLEYDKHADAWYGAELSRVYMDEFQKFNEYAFHILRSRLRSRAQVKSCMRLTLNPDYMHFCYMWIKPFLDEEGFPIKELSGRTRYFLLIGGTLHSDWDIHKLYEKFPDKKPQTYTYIPSTLEDNKVLQELEPGYKDTLDALPEKKRKQMLLGCWAPDEDNGVYFQRGWLNKITKDNLPSDMVVGVGIDMASEPPTDNNKFPDWTYGTVIGKKDGFYYVLGAFRMRERIGARNQRIINEIKKLKSIYGDGVFVCSAVDPAAAGKVAWAELAKVMAGADITLKKDPVPNNKSKKVKFEPTSNMLENGLFYICEELFDKEVLEDWYTQGEVFDGVTGSSSHRKDDGPDSLCMIVNVLNTTREIKPFTVPDISSPTRLSAHRQGH